MPDATPCSLRAQLRERFSRRLGQLIAGGTHLANTAEAEDFAALLLAALNLAKMLMISVPYCGLLVR